MGPRSVLEISPLQIIQFCSGVLGCEPDPTMLAEVYEDEESEEEESESEKSVEEHEEEMDGAQADELAPDNAEFGGRGGFSLSEDDADSMNDNTSDNKAEVEDSQSAEEDADNGSLAPSEEEAHDDEDADEDEDDDASLDGGWQYDDKRYATADSELQRVVAEGSSMDGFLSFEDLGYSKYSPRTRSGQSSGVYVSVHKEGDGSYLVKIGKGTKRIKVTETRGPLDIRLRNAHIYRGSYGMVKAYKAPANLVKMVPSLEEMIKIHSASFKGKEYTGTESFRMSNKAQALRYLRRIDFWIQKCFDERKLTIPASATEMEGEKQICVRRKDEDVSQSIFYVGNKEGLAGAGVAYNPAGYNPGGVRGDEKRRADKFRAFFSPLDFNAKVDYLKTEEGKEDAKTGPVTAWKKAIRQEWKANRLTPHQITRLLSIPVYRDSAMKGQIEGEKALKKNGEMLGAFQTTYRCPGKYPDPQATQLSDDDRKLGAAIQSCVTTWRKPNPEAGWPNIEKYAKLYLSLGIAEFERKPTRKKKRGKPTKAAKARGARIGSVYTRSEQKWMDDVRARSIFTNADFAKWKEETNAPDSKPASGIQFVYPAGNDSRDEIILYQSSNGAEAKRAMAKLVEDKALGDAVKYNNATGMGTKVDADERWNGLWIRSYGGTDDGWCKGRQAEAAKKKWIESMKQKKAAAPAKRPVSWPSGPPPTREKRTRTQTDRFEATETIKSQATGQRHRRSK